MTAKEKARELVRKYTFLMGAHDRSKGKTPTPELGFSTGKKCAIACIDEILQTNPTIKGNSKDLLTMIVQTKAYWYLVQDEIRKL